MSGRGAVLVAVESELFGLLLTEILGALRDNPVVNASGKPLPSGTDHYVAALVSKPVADQPVADVVITLPGPGESVGEVRHGGERRPLTITGTQDVVEALNRFWPRESEPERAVPTA